MKPYAGVENSTEEIGWQSEKDLNQTGTGEKDSPEKLIEELPLSVKVFSTGI